MPRRPVKLTAALAAALSLVPAGAPAHAQTPAPAPAASATAPAAVGLDDAAWQYAPDPHDRGRRRGWQRGRGAAPWRPVQLPHVFDARPRPSTFGGQVGWYRLRLRRPAGAPARFDWGVRFEQVRRVAQVWLDGRRVMSHRDPYAPFTVPLPALRDGRRHTLVVRVDSRKDDTVREGWWNWGGITRPATLVPLGRLVTASPGFLPERNCDATGGRCGWSVLVDAVVVNRAHRTLRPRLAARLVGPDGGAAGAAGARVRPLAPGERARVRFRLPVAGPVRLWQPGDPTLYDVALETRSGATLEQVDRARVGLRTVAVHDGALELNGRPVQLRGASIQEDVKGHGAALTDADIDAIVERLKALGADVTRAHYALDPRLADKLDEAGILVWAQAPVYHRDRLLETPAQRRRALGMVRAAVLATRNHPSTLTHSVANELSTIPDQVPGTAAFLRSARRLTRDLDPALPVAVDTLSYPGYGAQRAYAAFDLLGINAYFGWYPGKVAHSTANLADLGPYLDHMRAMYPAAGLVLTEFGAEATMDGPADVKETYAFQADYARDVLAVVRRHPEVSGTLWWTLQEFAIKPRWDGGALRTGVPRDSIHNKGLITYGGRRKPAWQVVHDDAVATPLFRPAAAARGAAPIRAPRAAGTGLGLVAGLGLLAAVALLLLVDAWALLGWRAASAAELRDAREAALRTAAAAGGDGDDRPRLRLIA
ncbi:MAG TPA: glycoside hydrolase family 2 TIM barrel-domain containing protein [Baekduia sp.]|nr:glycoside hydrolase family 2 TIM barrel-domain containing protein [Baekduia sp.]